MDPFLDRALAKIEEQADPGADFRREWREKARPEQIPPDEPFRTIYLQGGRGAGKTWSGAHILAEWILEDPEPGEWGIVAPTYQDAWSTCVEGPSGFLAALRTNVTEVRDGRSRLVEHWHRSFAEIRLRSGHLVRVASAQDGGLRVQGKNLKGAWCIAEGERVAAERGDVPIESVLPGEMVWTREGWRRVLSVRRTGASVPVVRVCTMGGASLRCTPDHRIWTDNRGWVEARALACGDILSIWNSSPAPPPGLNGRAFAGTAVPRAAIIPTARAACCTLPSGSASTGGASQTAMWSITAITTRATMTRATCNCSPAASTCATTTPRTRAASRSSHPACAPRSPGSPGRSANPASAPASSAERRSCPPASGLCTAPPAAASRGTKPTPLSAPSGPSALAIRSRPASASTAAALSSLLTSGRSTASANARSGLGTPLSEPAPARDSGRQPASIAGPSSPRRTGARSSALAPAESGTLVASVVPDGLADVYDLTVESAHEFAVNGIIVHNCDEVGLWENWDTTWNESIKFAVREGEARIVATGTPKQSRAARKLVKSLIDDPSVPVRRLRTVDNAPNLAPRFLADVVAAAKGTRLERQELEGLLLDDVEGALWTAEIIDAYRVNAAPADLLRVVVAIDPAVSNQEGSDETGIVVAGEGDGGHGFVLEDCSMRGTPDECMRRAVKAYRQWQADCVVAEANNGGDFIGSLLRTVDPDVPYRKVVATRGKRVRAEPVSALYEQGRMHHCGVFPELEDQMVSWVPSDPESPDRVDALCWAAAELRGLSAGSWLEAYGTVRCEACGGAYAQDYGACPRCEPGKARKPERAAAPVKDAEPEPMTGWGSAYGAVRCPAGHAFIPRGGRGCPRCLSPGRQRRIV